MKVICQSIVPSLYARCLRTALGLSIEVVCPSLLQPICEPRKFSSIEPSHCLLPVELSKILAQLCLVFLLDTSMSCPRELLI